MIFIYLLLHVSTSQYAGHMTYVVLWCLTCSSYRIAVKGREGDRGLDMFEPPPLDISSYLALPLLLRCQMRARKMNCEGSLWKYGRTATSHPAGSLAVPGTGLKESPWGALFCTWA